MSLIKQLRDEIVDYTFPASAVLRKAKILAASLDQPEFSKWLSFELNGYSDRDSLPDYRRLGSPLLGTFRGPFESGVENYSIPVSLLPDFMRESATELVLAHSIRELESMVEGMAATGNHTLRHTLPTEAVLLARDHVRLSGGMVLVEMHQPITKSSLEGIVDSVRTRFLDFLLGLQHMNAEVLVSEAAIIALPSDQVAQIFNVSVYGNNNVVAANSTVQDNSVQAIMHNDARSLTTYLKGIGVADADTEELRNAIETDGPPKENEQLGTRVKAWLGSMVGKAIDGTWKMTLATGPELLKEALFRYYGWK